MTGPPGPLAEPPVPGQAADAAMGLTGRARRAWRWATGRVESGSHWLQEARTTSRVVDSALSAFESETETGEGSLLPRSRFAASCSSCPTPLLS